MKATLFFVLFATIVTAQTDTIKYASNATSRPPCPYIIDTKIGFGYYRHEFESIKKENWATLKNQLELILETKDVEYWRKRDESTFFSLMRLKDIEWGDTKNDVEDFLTHFAEQILKGKSFLSSNNRNILYRENGCPLPFSASIYLPQSTCWVLMSMNTEKGAKFIEDIWDTLLIDELYSNEVRFILLHIMSKYYKNEQVQNTLHKIYDKTAKLSYTDRDISLINKFVNKFEVFKSNNQNKLWEKFISNNSNNTNLLMSHSNNWICYDYLAMIEDIFENPDIEIPLNLAEKTNDIKIKYLLAYCCCGLINRNQLLKRDTSIIKRIDNLVAVIQKSNLKDTSEVEIDFVDRAYQALKK